MKKASLSRRLGAPQMTGVTKSLRSTMALARIYPVVAMAAAHAGSEALAKSARGDQAAFGWIVREHQAMVFSIACHFLRDRNLAEELAQEVFLHLHKNLHTIQSPA